MSFWTGSPQPGVARRLTNEAVAISSTDDCFDDIQAFHLRETGCPVSGSIFEMDCLAGSGIRCGRDRRVERIGVQMYVNDWMLRRLCEGGRNQTYCR